MRRMEGDSRRAAHDAASSPQWTHVPRLVVFDLDYTLWCPYIDVLSGGPFTKTEDPGTVLDRYGEELSLLPDVQKVLNILEMDPQFEGTKVAIASRTGEIEAAKECMRLIEVDIKGEVKTLSDIASFVEIYPTCKIAHFKKFLQQSGVAYEDMLFFDDEYRNIQDVARLGVTCQYCQDGVTWNSWLEGIQAYQQAKLK
ncbi:magnesium-dependent phosphatase-1 [Phytophthora nicotianae CJ01A1]|uniref:Magnesium-dependent phosphatase-1 n=6 Tax=Phytophthora nicotianae TaxID=4792 RepID=W2QUW6_PHYN3|nr:magnesium-dependent phosphatase-1 [Phytophthora nicotianae INRA-310]ETI32508.1 magnesium-dependent phosphatase-1 [Phytophthora nicotianae P1569]ETK72876.1 magnesium-dependent phosphatase-1 [Phytophthora nicotianae]ETO61241.1 magnesium-dependent phosphatase-1 [Phytophthora nicotianae P1976]ETP02348.1 magnesium-dependent phosphatase-1 [Phytophthora nicotianae CJ01A1]ETP30530.1 magnesium-dependent phosphatase-1 [Phytophthora nicotianae P10297]KUG00392.1 Magnesium-dependent phosphatase 1 [Phyt